MQTQYSVLEYRIDLYFHDYKLAIEIDKNGHRDRNVDSKIKREKATVDLLIVDLLELILTKKTLIFLKLSMRYSNTSNNRLIN